MLNTQHPGVVAGFLAGAEIQALEQAVDEAQRTGRPLLGDPSSADSGCYGSMRLAPRMRRQASSAGPSG